ncbi:MAG: hypothetical protein ABI426_03760 [Flavobacterium sp.]
MIEVVIKILKTIIMLKNILNLEGTQKLTKNEQKNIQGGMIPSGCLKWNPITRVCSLWDPNY